MSVFRRDRTARSDASMPISAGGASARSAADVLRLAWRRDLYEMRCLTEEQFQAAVADDAQAYEALRRAQSDNVPGGIADARIRFETAARRKQARTEDRDRIDAMLAAHFGGESAASVASPSATGLARMLIQWPLALRKRIPPRAGHGR